MSGYTVEEVEGATNAILQVDELLHCVDAFVDLLRCILPSVLPSSQGPDTDKGAIHDMMMSLKRGESSSATVFNYKKGGEKFLIQARLTMRLSARPVHSSVLGRRNAVVTGASGACFGGRQDCAVHGYSA